MLSMFNRINIPEEAASQRWVFLHNDRELNRSCVKPKMLLHRLSGRGFDVYVFFILELAVFLNRHSEFDGIINDWDYFDKLIWEIEKKYDIDVFDYIFDYENLEKLLELPCLNNK